MSAPTKELSVLDQLAILMVQEEQIWQLCSDNDWPDNLRAVHTAACEKTQDFANQHFGVQYSFIGSLPDDDDRSHYDIDDQIDKHFDKKTVQADSESGMFAVYVAEEMLSEVESWLNENWPTLKYKVTKDDDAVKPLVNWHAARKHVEDNNLVVESLIGQEIYDKISSFDRQIKLLEGEKECYIKSIQI
jgi:hypothetical protein